MKISRKIICAMLCLTLSPVFAFSQETENAAAQKQIQQMQEEIQLLKKQQELERAKNELADQRLAQIMDALPKSSVKTLEGKNEFRDTKQANPETIALSYEALREISAQINEKMRANFSPFSRLVIYDEADFVALARYRTYRSESKMALRNYDLLAENIAKLNKETRSSGDAGELTGTRGGVDPLSMALSLPGIGTSVARSVAELFAVFRTDTTITETSDTVDEATLATVLASEIKRNNAAVRIYHPQAFVPEYDLDAEGEDSMFNRMSRIGAADANLEEFLAASNKIPEAKRSLSPFRETFALAEIVKRQLQSLDVANAKPTVAPENKMSEFRQLIRAEKLDRFLRGGESSTRQTATDGARVGVLKVRVLASGGSRRETNNLFTGSKISYSGSAVIEILLFDVDGTLQGSEVFSAHTGFRKMKPKNN